jgi:hypothetical protein
MNEFDHRPDQDLGNALRDLLSAPDDAAFATRVMERVPQTIVRETPFGILGEWARPGLAAAVAALVAMTVWLSGQPAQEFVATVDEAVAAESLSAQTLLASEVVPEFRVEMVMGEERVNE